jgi:hypothetical protein
MISSNEFKAIAELDLDPIKVKLMHGESGEGWPLEKVNAVEVEYRRFLYLMKKFPNEQTAPSVNVDTFWHYHILDTMKYAADCQQVFGYFLHHFPYLGMRGEEDAQALQRAGQRMGELYEAAFGAPEQHAAVAESGKDNAWCGAAVKAAWCGAAKEASAAPAWCGAATQASSAPAWCGAATQASSAPAWCGAAKEMSAGTAAWCGAADKAGSYSVRPTLATAA